MDDPGSLRALDSASIKLLRLCMLPICGWPDLRRDRQTPVFKMHTLYAIIQVFIVLGEIYYLYRNFGVVEFLLLGDVYITTFTTVSSTARLILPTFASYHFTCKKFLTEFHLIYFKHKTQFQKIFSTVDKFSYYYAAVTAGMFMSGVTLFNLSPLYVNFSNGAFTTNRHNMKNITLQFSVNYMYPGYDQREHFYSSTLINIYLSFLCSLSVIGFDLLMILMIFQIIGHLEIIARNMRSITKPRTTRLINKCINQSNITYVVALYDADENFEVKQRLKDIVDHHRLIISFTDNVSATFGPILGITYMYHLVSCCLLLLECSRGDPDVIVQYAPLTIIVFLELIQLSVIYEVVGSKSEAFIDCVYELPWQYMSVENQRIVYIMLCRAQRPIRVNAFGLVDVGIQTMASILKTTFSYYTFLRSL